MSEGGTLKTSIYGEGLCNDTVFSNINEDCRILECDG